MATKYVEMNDRGQVTLPAEVREYLRLAKDEQLEVEIGSGGIVLLRTEPRRLTAREEALAARVKELKEKARDGWGALNEKERGELMRDGSWLRVFELDDSPALPDGQASASKYLLPGEAQPAGRSYVTLSPRGQVTLPMKQRRRADLREGDRFTIDFGAGMIILKPTVRRLTHQEAEAIRRGNYLAGQDELTEAEELELSPLLDWVDACQLYERNLV